MHSLVRYSLFFFVLVLGSVLFFSFTFPVAAAADPCPGSGHISTGTGEDSGIPAGSKICPGDGGQKQLFGGCDTNPYVYLEQRHKGDRSNSFITPRGGGLTSAQYGLNPGLACRLMKFMQFAETKGCPILISSAMRPVQRCNPTGGACAPQGSSCHQYGLAVDVSASPQCLNWILATLGRKNAASPFGIHSAYAEHEGYRHLQCVENLQASCSPQTKGCGGDFTITPDTSGIPGPGTPTSAIANAVRSYVGTQPQIQPQPSLPTQSTPPTPINATQPLPSQNQFCFPEYKCQGNALTYLNSTCSTQIQQCTFGCRDGACLPSSNSTSTNENTNTATSTLSLLNSFANPTTATTTTIGTSTPLSLIWAISQGSQVSNATENAQQGHVIASTSLINLNPLGAQQTFTSGDLNGGAPQTAALDQRSRFLAILDDMRKALVAALSYLRPFQISQARAQQNQPEFTE